MGKKQEGPRKCAGEGERRSNTIEAGQILLRVIPALAPFSENDAQSAVASCMQDFIKHGSAARRQASGNRCLLRIPRSMPHFGGQNGSWASVKEQDLLSKLSIYQSRNDSSQFHRSFCAQRIQITSLSTLCKSIKDNHRQNKDQKCNGDNKQ